MRNRFEEDMRSRLVEDNRWEEGMGNQPQHSENGNLSAAVAVAVDDRDHVDERTASTNSDPLDLPQPAEEETDMVDESASGLTQAIVTMARQLEKARATEQQAVEGSMRRQDQELQAVTARLEAVQQSIDQVAESSAALTKGQYEQLLADTTSLRQAVASHEKTLTDLGRQMQDRFASVSDRFDPLLGEVEGQQKEISDLKSTVADVSPRVAALVGRLDRQGEAIRSFYEVQKQREGALEELNQILSSLKASLAPFPAVLPEKL